MTGNLFRITVDEPNYSRVLGTHPDDSRLAEADLAHLQGSRLWAQRTSEKGKQVHDTLAPDDGLLFYKVQRGYAHDEGQYVAVGHVGEKLRLDEQQAEHLFRTSVAQLAYTVTDFEPIAKSIGEVEQILGYGSYPQSNHRVTSDRYNSVEQALQRLSR